MRNHRSDIRFLGRAVDAIMGKDAEGIITPERMRNEYLLRFLLFLLPVLLLLVAIDIIRGVSPFSLHRIVALLMIISCLTAFRLRRFSLAIDILFFGIVFAILLGFLLSARQDWKSLVSGEFISLVAITLLTAISFVGLYSGSRFRVDLMFALALVFDLGGFFLPYGQAFGSITTWVTIIAFHSSAYGFGLFLITYFNNISRTAESRRLMIHRLEELVAEANASGISRLESLSHDIRSPFSDHRYPGCPCAAGRNQAGPGTTSIFGHTRQIQQAVA